MSCQARSATLVAWHLGEVDPAERAEFDAHLTSCQACVRDFVALKHSLETGGGARPSPAARAALRAAVAAQVAPPPAWRWWERPLAVGLATAALLLAVAAVGQVGTGAGRAPHALAASSR